MVGQAGAGPDTQRSGRTAATGGNTACAQGSGRSAAARRSASGTQGPGRSATAGSASTPDA